VLYLVGEPRNAVLSVFRRGIQVGHYRFVHRREPTEEEMAQLANLDTYLAAGVDLFDFADHLDRWLTAEHEYPTLFFRFESLADVWPQVRDAAGLPPDTPCLPLRPRHSDWSALAEPQRTSIQRMYGALAARIEAMPPVG
jgi:hypothetical protein